MSKKRLLPLVLVVAGTALVAACATGGGGSPMSFFITSANPGKGGDLGGLDGADKYCQQLAASVGAGNKTWRAYLSTQATGSQPAVNARDRIGKGPWMNVKGVVVATSVDDLHSANNKLGKQTSLTEKGGVVNGRGDTPNMHDILTGSTPDGRAPAAGNDMTCGNWTSSKAGSAILGHHDRDGINPNPVANVSWNSSHPSRGCDMDALKATGSAGLMYCFAAN
ncbi:hypothetical protein [Caenimonas koreensis]|uniref:hypothetical protein n=1 Tax=Caenimonas koreensis TaxID=367474 RepID=UPI0037832E6C